MPHQSLYEAGVKRKGTDVAVWIGILTRGSAPHLQRGEPRRAGAHPSRARRSPPHASALRARMLVFQRYKSYSPYDLKESIGKEVKGDLEKSFLALGTPPPPLAPPWQNSRSASCR